jgi:hypothetical protein
VNTTAVSDLAEDLRDVVLDYQVSTGTIKPAPDGSLMRPTVLAAEGDLQPKLHIDCESQDPRFEMTLDINNPCRTQVRRISTSDWRRLTIQQLNRWC